MAKHERNLKEDMERVQIWRDALTEVANISGYDSRNYRNEARLIEEIIQSILAGKYRDWMKSVDGGMGPRIRLDEKYGEFFQGMVNHLVGAIMASIHMRLPEIIERSLQETAQGIWEAKYEDWRKSVDKFGKPRIQLDEIHRESFRGTVINLVDAIMVRIQLINRHDDLTVGNVKRTAISIRASVRSVSPNDKAIMGDLIRLADEMRDLIEFIGPVDDAAVRDLIQLTRETEALTRSPLPIDDGIPVRLIEKLLFPSVAPDKKLFRSRMEEVRSISSDHVGEDSKGQGKLSTISGRKNPSIKFRTSIKARLLGLTWSATIKARLRAEQVLIVLHYVNDSIVSSYTNASILILVVGSWNLLYVLFLQSCEDVFHGSPVTIFCELKLSDLRSCEVGCFGNPLNWGDGVVRGIIPA
ncbi:hypothetical protein PVL29_024931 [Vitis rotundifolia]|nr:hypothetical protein PVL29_024931 [Vitis rotundifolia]